MANTEKPKQDMGTGSVKKLMVKMAVPALVGQVVNLLYNIVDRIYIGHIPEIGASALTGVGLFTPILMLITAFAMMMGSGGAPLAAIALSIEMFGSTNLYLFGLVCVICFLLSGNGGLYGSQRLQFRKTETGQKEHT